MLHELWLQDAGTLALLGLIATTILIRARHFCTYGKEAMAVFICYVACTVPIRYLTSHEFIEGPTARVLSGYVAIVALGIQFPLLYLGEMARRAAHRRAELEALRTQIEEVKHA